VPYIQYNAGDDWGLLGFDKSLTEEEIGFVKETLKTIDGKDVEWAIPPG
jgi:lupus La protein